MIMNRKNIYKPNNKEELDIELTKYFDWWTLLPDTEKKSIMIECGVQENKLLNYKQFFSELDFLDKKRIFEYYSEYKVNKALKELKGE